MEFYENLNSARRVSEAMQEQAKRHNEMLAAAQRENEHRQKVDGAQLQTAEELKSLREKFEQSQKEQDENLRKQQEQHEIEMENQAKESRFNKRLAIGSIIVAVISAIFGGASLVVSVIALRG